jgi:hypothetical protein
MLRYQRAQSVQHVSRHVRIGILVNSKASGGVSHIKHNHSLTLARLLQLFSDEISKLYEFFSLTRLNF